MVIIQHSTDGVLGVSLLETKTPLTIVEKRDHFQKCHFSDSTVGTIDELVCIDSKSLESHVVTARILYEYEKTIFK